MHIQPQTFRILLVGTGYDVFTLQEAGFREESEPLQEIDEETKKTGKWLQYLEMDNIFTNAETPDEALSKIKNNNFDIVICDLITSEYSTFTLSNEIKKINPSLKICLVTSNPDFWGTEETWPQRGNFDLVLTWHGNGQLLRSIILLHKDSIEKTDIPREYQPRSILLVEDEPRLAGLYLPSLHQEIFDGMREILPPEPPEDLLLRILQERPRLFYATTYEQAEAMLTKHADNLLGLITDVQFPKEGKLQADAGFELAEMARRLLPTLPIAIQSVDSSAKEMASAIKSHFILKEPNRLLSGIRNFLIEYLGFGPFIFRMPDGTEVGRANDLPELVKLAEECPLESFLYHAGNNHFSAWLSLHGYRQLAIKLAPLKARNENDRKEDVKIMKEFIEKCLPECCPYY